MYRLPVDLSRDGFYVIFDKVIEKRNLYFQTFEAFVEFCFKNPHLFFAIESVYADGAKGCVNPARLLLADFEINFLSAFADIIINHDLLGEIDEYFLSIDDSLSESADTRKEKFNTFFATIDKYQDEFNDYQSVTREYLAGIVKILTHYYPERLRER
jgi:hypothetical protein